MILSVLAALIIPFFGMHVGEASAASLSSAGSYRTALIQLERDGVPVGVLNPIEVVTTSSASAAVRARLAALPGVHAAIDPAGGGFHRAGRAIVDVLPAAEA